MSGEDDERYTRKSSPQPGRRLRGGKVTGRRETGRKETGRKTTGAKERGVGETESKETGGKDMRTKVMGVRETGGKVSGGKATGAQVSQETGGKGDRLTGERETDNSLPCDKVAGEKVMEGIQQKSYTEAVIEGVRKRARMFVGDSIVGKIDRVLNKGDYSDKEVSVSASPRTTETQMRSKHKAATQSATILH